jgi:hypothetical protein
LLTIIFCCTITIIGVAQTTEKTEQQLEFLADNEDAETEDDSYLQQLEQLKKNKLDINDAEASDLKMFPFLTELQIQSFLQYRKLLGKFISLYELQAIPYWDVETINKLLPYIQAGNALNLKEDLLKRFTSGQHSLLLRESVILEKAKGFTATGTTPANYQGDKNRILVRYKYSYKNLLQYGIVADKDAGEQMFKGYQNKGFDFYSFHFFMRNRGILKALALGDFTVNLGQGLLSWQSLAFRKSSDVTNIKRQADIIRPYNSAGEYNYHRGAAITVQLNKFTITAFVSSRKASASTSIDTVTSEEYFSSFNNSGLHRTINENNSRNNINQFTTGGAIVYNNGNLHVGFNAINYSFSKPLLKSNEPYNTFTFQGKQLTGTSIDYNYTYKNVHLFGEAAASNNKKMAHIHGLIASLSNTVDASLLYRNINKAYHSLYSNAFTESTVPINENGFYSGLSIKPAYGFRVDLYADVYKFPWLKFRVNRPSTGSDYLAQLTWKPNKQLEIYTRYRSETKAINNGATANTDPRIYETNNTPRKIWRIHSTYKISPAITIKNRAEMIWYNIKPTQEQGFLMYADFVYKPMMSALSLNTRLQYFETDGFNTRIYAYENDVLYGYSIPSFSGKGYRWYINANYDVNKKLSTWLRLSQTYMPEAKSIGSGNDEILKNRKTELRLQLIYTF